jgi:hypothetical protein
MEKTGVSNSDLASVVRVLTKVPTLLRWYPLLPHEFLKTRVGTEPVVRWFDVQPNHICIVLAARALQVDDGVFLVAKSSVDYGAGR